MKLNDKINFATFELKYGKKLKPTLNCIKNSDILIDPSSLVSNLQEIKSGE